MRSRQVAVVAKREYMARLRSKAFWISTVLIPVLMAAWAILPSLFMAKSKASQRLAIVDRTGQIAAPLVEELEDWSERTARQVAFDIERLEPSPDDEAQRAELDRRVLDGEIQAWLWIGENSLDENSVEYHAESVSNFLTQEALERALSSVARTVRLEGAGYDVATIGRLTESIDLDTVRVSEDGSREEGGLGGFALAFALFMLLYMTTLIYGQQVMNGILEEKSSRVVEVVLAVTRPTELMAGKLVGIGLVGLTQLVIWIASMLVLTAPAVVGAIAFIPPEVSLPTISPILLVHFFFHFLLGYFFYATLYAMIGASFNNVQEAQQMAGVAVVFVVAPWMFFMPIVNDPDSTLAVVTSLIPFFTPLLMMLRMALKMPPLWQVLLGYALTTLLCVAMTWLCARIYRVGILMYGKKPTIQEIWRWIRYAA